MVDELRYWKTPPNKAFFMGLFLKNVTYAGKSWADFNKKAEELGGRLPTWYELEKDEVWST